MGSADPNLGRRLGHFRLVGRLGAGGMGVVYRAEDERLRREVAVKLLPPHATADPARRARMLREARSAAAVRHPNIAAVHAIEEAEDGAFYLVLELVDGDSLRALLAERGTLPEAEALRIGIEIARGLARAHEAGIVHRDLKPENVMIGPEGEVKILDFGLARMESSRLGASEGAADGSVHTAEGAILGTPEYMAPEQARSSRVGPEADVFAVGVMLFEMMMGRRPFRAETPLGVIAAILTEDAPPLVGATEPAVALVARLLSKDPASRPRDGRALSAELRATAGVPSHDVVVDAARASGASPRATPSPADGPAPTPASDAGRAPTPTALRHRAELGEARTLSPEPQSGSPVAPSLRGPAGLSAAGHESAVAPPRSDGTSGRVRSGLALAATVVVLAGLASLASRLPAAPVSGAEHVEANDAGLAAAAVAGTSGGPLPVLRSTRVDLPSAVRTNCATLAPDGATVALCVGDELMVRDVEGIGLRRLALPAGATPVGASWDPGGQSLTVSASSGDLLELLHVGLDGTVERLRSGSAGAVSPDGRWLAFHDGTAWAVAPRTGGAARVLIEAAGTEERGRSAEWSPGSDAIIVQSEVSRRLVHVPLSGEPVTLLRGSAVRLGGAYSSGIYLDGRTALVVEAAPDVYGSRVCAVPLYDPDARRCLASTPGVELTGLTVDAARRRIAWIERSARSEVAVGRLGPGALGDVEVVTPPDGSYRPHAWLDDDTLVVSANHHGRWEVVAWPLDGEPRILAARDDADFTHPAVAPDGGIVAFRLGVSSAGSESEPVPVSLVRIDPGGSGAVETILALDGLVTETNVLGRPPPDRGALVCGAARCAIVVPDGGFELVLDLSGRRIATLPAPPNVNAALTWGGQALEIVSGNTTTWIDLDTGVVEARPASDGTLYWSGFGPDGARYATRGDLDHNWIERVTPDGITTELIADTSDWYGQPVVSPDGTRLAFVRRNLGVGVAVAEVPAR